MPLTVENLGGHSLPFPGAGPSCSRPKTLGVAVGRGIARVGTFDRGLDRQGSTGSWSTRAASSVRDRTPSFG
jgi:hypothetical protein